MRRNSSKGGQKNKQAYHTWGKQKRQDQVFSGQKKTRTNWIGTSKIKRRGGELRISRTW